jgi:hypothetical protein
MNTIDVIEILKITGIGYFIIDFILLMYVWTWKEIHYRYKILFFPIPFTGVVWITSDYKKTFEEFSQYIQHQLI